MGWTVTNRPKGMTTLEFFKGEFEHPEGNSEVIAAFAPNFHEAYLAVEVKPQQGDPFVTAVACHTRYKRDPYFNFGYKDVPETSGPNITHCPMEIFEHLSPLRTFLSPDSKAYEWALEWRRGVLRYNDLRAAMAEAVSNGGTYIRTESPISFRRSGDREIFWIESLRPCRIYSHKPDHNHLRPTRYKLSPAVLADYGARPISATEAERIMHRPQAA